MDDHPSVLNRLFNWLNDLDVQITERISLTAVERRRHRVWVWLAHIGAHAGDSLLWAAITALLWRRANGDRDKQRQLIGWAVSFVVARSATLGIKHTFKRRRPAGGRFLYGRGADVHSFPSGHGSRSGIILTWATALHPTLGRWAPLLILWIGWSRVATGVHYVGDVVVGFLLGMGLGESIRLLWNRSLPENHFFRLRHLLDRWR